MTATRFPLPTVPISGLGVATFPAETNPNPTWWHSRDYSVIVANGFGVRVLPPVASS